MIYIIFVVVALIILSAIYFIFKIKGQLSALESNKLILSNDYFRERMLSWGSVNGRVEFAEVKPKSVFVPGGSVYKYHLEGVVTYTLQGNSYRCNLSPYIFFVTNKRETAEALRNLLSTAEIVPVFYNPEKLDDSFFILGNYLSWEDFESNLSSHNA
jgi:hypothetical protein